MTTVATPPRPRRRWLRFSLRTLLLATLLAGSGGTLWTHLEPWVCVRTVPFGLAELWVSPDGRTLCAIQNRGTKVHILDADTLEQRAICDNSTWKIEALSFSLDSRRILTTCNNLDDTGAKHEKEKYLFVWDADSGKQLAAITRPGGHSDINFARLSPDAKKLIAIQNSDSKVLFYAIADGSLIRKISEAEVSVLCPKQPSPEEQKVIDETTSRATAQAERTVTLDEFTRAVVQLHVPGALSSDGRWLLTYLHGKSTIWDVASETRVSTLDFPLSNPVFSPDGRWVAGQTTDDGEDHTTVCDLHTGKRICRLEGSVTRSDNSKFSADARRVLVGDVNQPLQVWELPEGTSFRPAECVRNQTRDECLTPDGQRVIARRFNLDTFEESLAIWDATAGNLLTQFASHDGFESFQCCISPTGNRAYVSSKDELAIWSRRRPEGRWGMAVMPELWLTILLTCALLWSLLRKDRPREPKPNFKI